MLKLIFVDTETTGLDLERHHVWEVGAITREIDEYKNMKEEEHHWFLHVPLGPADPIALDIGGFFQRHPFYEGKLNNDKPRSGWLTEVSGESAFAHDFFRLSFEAFFVGACPDFDAYRIAKILRNNGLIPKWNYHLIDVENLLAGHLSLPPPWKWRETLPKIGINLDNYEQHTAIGDARLARDTYDNVMAATVE